MLSLTNSERKALQDDYDYKKSLEDPRRKTTQEVLESVRSKISFHFIYKKKAVSNYSII
jgi:hypothetical protein